MAAIGTAEIVHAAARGELITDIFVNNGVYGMTGGQMAPTTLLGQRMTSTPTGRDARMACYPIPITEMLALLPGVAYAARGSVAVAAAIGRTRAMIKRACEVQLEGAGFAIVEVLANCPVGWGMSAVESLEHLAHEVNKTYPVGVHHGPDTARPGAARHVRAIMEHSTIFAGFGGQGLLLNGTSRYETAQSFRHAPGPVFSDSSHTPSPHVDWRADC